MSFNLALKIDSIVKFHPSTTLWETVRLSGNLFQELNENK